MGTSSLTQYPVHQPANPEEYESAEAPVIGLARGDPKPRSRANSRASNHTVKTSRSLKNLFTEPILTSKKEYMTEEGYPRTEFVWRHPPVFEDAIGRTQPVTINAGFGDYNAYPQQFLEDSLRNLEPVRSARDEEPLLFRDSGYGSGGMLPGLSALAPMLTAGTRMTAMLLVTSARTSITEGLLKTISECGREEGVQRRESPWDQVRGGTVSHMWEIW